VGAFSNKSNIQADAACAPIIFSPLFHIGFALMETPVAGFCSGIPGRPRGYYVRHPSTLKEQSSGRVHRDVIVFVDGTNQGSGPVTTPVTLLFIGGTVDGVVHPLASCASGCVSIAVQLASATGGPFHFTLLDGQEFTTPAITTAALEPLPGKKFIQAQQSVPIVVKRDASGK
jgi:hypothetical protein